MANGRGGSIRNDSNIGHNVDKMRSCPVQGRIIAYRENFKHDTTTATITWDIPWSARKSWIDWVLGYSYTEISPGRPEPLLRRIMPAQHPEFPWLYADEVDLVDGIGSKDQSESSYAQKADGTRAEHNGKHVLFDMVSFIDNQGDNHFDGYARYAVTYRDYNFEIRTDEEIDALPFNGLEMWRYVSREKSLSVQGVPIVRIANQTLKFVPGSGAFSGVTVPEGGLLLFPAAQLTLTWHAVPDVPDVAIEACLGKVNAEPLPGVAGDLNYTQETLLFQGPKYVRRRGPTGRVTWDISYRFDFRPQGWNKYPASDGQFYRATLGGGENNGTVFQKANHTNLFKVPNPVSYQ